MEPGDVDHITENCMLMLLSVSTITFYIIFKILHACHSRVISLSQTHIHVYTQVNCCVCSFYFFASLDVPTIRCLSLPQKLGIIAILPFITGCHMLKT